MTDRLFLTPAEAADRLGMRESTLRRKAQQGLIPHRKDGAFLKFTEDDLLAYVEATKVPLGQRKGKTATSANPFQTTRAKKRTA